MRTHQHVMSLCPKNSLVKDLLTQHKAYMSSHHDTGFQYPKQTCGYLTGPHPQEPGQAETRQPQEIEWNIWDRW